MMIISVVKICKLLIGHQRDNMNQLYRIREKFSYHYRIGGIWGIFFQLHQHFPVPVPNIIKWKMGVVHEIRFWEKVFNQENEYWPGFKKRLDSNRPIEGALKELLAEIDIVNPLILDVGAGPITYLSTGGFNSYPTIRACDALAIQYDKILLAHKIQPKIRTELCETEHLTHKFNCH
ncbi:MAG: hypothetical protein KKC46_07870 [Proteobacteria bacterium]|nr:hypothetical protein [Pseudomonadota bacterium]